MFGGEQVSELHLSAESSKARLHLYVTMNTESESLNIEQETISEAQNFLDEICQVGYVCRDD